MMTVRLICVGKMKERFYTDAYAEYAKRLSAYCRLELTELPESTPEKEAAAIEKSCGKSGYVIAMAIEGRKLSSEEFAAMLERLALSGRSEVCFLIGGSVGLAESIKKNSDFLLSMSDMTFPHHLARVMLAEQIYRAFKINEGSVYHK